MYRYIFDVLEKIMYRYIFDVPKRGKMYSTFLEVPPPLRGGDVVTVSWLNDFFLTSRLQMLDIDLVG